MPGPWEDYKAPDSADESGPWNDHAPARDIAAAPQSPQEQIGGLEATARGAGAGLSLGFSPRIIAGAQALGSPGNFKDAYNAALAEQNQREELAKQQHPILYRGAEFGVPLAIPALGALGEAGALGDVGGAAAEGLQAINLPGKVAEAGTSALEAVPGAEAAAEAHPLINKVLQGAAGGAAIGGVAGAAQSSDLSDIGQTAQSALSGAKTGAEFGGVIGGAGAAVSGAAEKFAGSPGILGDISSLYLKGLGQEDLRDFDKISDQAYEYGQITGNKIFQDNVKVLKAKFNAFQEAGEMSGKQAAIEDIFGTLNDMRQSAEENADPDQLKTINQLINMFQNKAYGLEQDVTRYNSKITTNEVPGQERVPSTEETLQNQADQLNANAKANSEETGEPLKTYEVRTAKDGRMNVIETSEPDAEGKQTVKPVNKNWLSPQAEVPEIEPNVEHNLELEKVIGKERPGMYNPETGEVNPPELTMNQAVEAEKQLGGLKSEAFAQGKFGQGKILSDIDKMISSKVDQIEPGYAEPREQWKNLLSALDKAGINKDRMLDMNIQQAGEETINDLKPEIMKKINNQIIQSQEPGLDGRVAKENLDRFFNYIEKSGVPDASELRANLENKLEDYRLSQSMQPGAFHPGIASHNPKVSALSFLKSYGGAAAHRVGLAAGNPTTTQLVSVAPGLASSVTGSARPNATPMENFSRNLSYGDPQQLKAVSAHLKSDPNLSYLGNALDKAVADNNQIQKNAIVFAISQNPNARKYLGEASGASK